MPNSWLLSIAQMASHLVIALGPLEATQGAVAQLVRFPEPYPAGTILCGTFQCQVVEKPLGFQIWHWLGARLLVRHGMGWLLHGLGVFHGLGLHGLGAFHGRGLHGTVLLHGLGVHGALLLHGLGLLDGLVEVLAGLHGQLGGGHLHGLALLHGLGHLHGAWHRKCGGKLLELDAKLG